MAYRWELITSGATFHELVGNLLLHADPRTNIYNRQGPDGAIDALSGDRKTVFQSKHHKNGTPGNAFADARAELAKIREYQKADSKWYPIWSGVTTWKLVTNVQFGPADDQKWHDDIVPKFAAVHLTAEYLAQPQLDKMLADYPTVADAFFGQRPRLFVSLAEHRAALRAREVLDRAYEIPLQGRDTDLEAIARFVRNSDHSVLLIHGPGGVGKSRLLVEAATQLIAEGAITSVYCGPSHLSTSDNWYVGIIPETKALVILDEPTDAGFIHHVLTQLRTRTKNWKVLVGVRTPRDPVIRALNDPREKLLAPAHELKPLEPDEALRYAQQLLTPLSLTDEEKSRVARWLRDVCGRIPIWMTVAITLLERNHNLRDLPKDEYAIAQKYIQDILENTRPEIGDAAQILHLLRWVALLQPVNQHAEPEIWSLAEAAGLEPAKVQIAIEDLVQKRVLTAFGIDQRMVEIRPDVLRDHLLISWLTVGGDGPRRPSIEAGELATELAGVDALSSLAAKAIRMLARVENLASPMVRLVDPVADAGIRLAEAAANTVEQQQALEFASTFAMARPGHLTRAVEIIRSRDVPEVTDETMFGRIAHTRARVVATLPPQLFLAAHAASSSDERRAILRELAALVDLQAEPRVGMRTSSDGKAAHELLPRVICERHAYRTSFHGEAAALAASMLDELTRTGQARPSTKIVLQSLLSIGRHEAYSDDDPNVLRLETSALIATGPLGKIATSIRARLWAIIEKSTSWSEPRALYWILLDHFHSELNRHRSDRDWCALLLDDLRRLQAIAVSSTTSLEDLHAARKLWRRHIEYGTPETKVVADACEKAYQERPFVAKFAAIFDGGTGDAMFEAAKTFDAQNVLELEGFLADAFRYVTSHTDDWYANRLSSFAHWLGEFHAASKPVYREFIHTHLRTGERDALHDSAIAMGAGYIAELRRAADPDSLSQALHGLAMSAGPQRLPALIITLFANASRVTAQRFGAVDYAFLTRHWDAFQALPISHRLVVLGRMIGTQNEALDLALEDLVGRDLEEQSEQILMIWRGFFDTLPYPLSADAIPSIASRLLEEIAMRPDSHGPQGNIKWELRKIMEHLPEQPLSYLVDLVRRRLAAYGENNRRLDEPGHRWIHILPDGDSFILERVAVAEDTAPGTDTQSAVEDLLALEHSDRTIGHDLPALLAHIDPHGRVVPELIAQRLTDPLRTPTVEAVTEAARFAGWYGLGGIAWRTIASAACARLPEFAGDAEAEAWVYSSLMPQRLESWSGRSGELHPRWQEAIDAAREAFEVEADAGLRGFWQWRISGAKRDLEIARGRLEERKI